MEMFDLLTKQERKALNSLIFQRITLVVAIAVGVYVMFIRGGNV